MIFTPLAAIALLASAAYTNASTSFSNIDTISDDAFKPGFAKNDLTKCVDTAAKLLAIDMDMRTDPSLIRDILADDMHIHDMPEVRKMLPSLDNQSLRPMLNKVREGITTVHPAVGIALCAALEDETTASIFSDPNADIIRRSMHHMFILDTVVAKLANNVTFMVNMQKHIQDTVNSMTPHHSAIGHMYDLFKAGGMFGVMKSYSINGAMNDYKTFRERGSMTNDESEARKTGLMINVLEATATDTVHGYFSNARVGMTLSQWHPKEINVSGPNNGIQYVNDMDYARLYETWNLAFITGNLDFPNMLYPKLLIPTVILADANSYLYKRVLALYLSLNFYLMADLTGKEHVKFAGSANLSSLWGKINLKYVNFLKPSKD